MEQWILRRVPLALAERSAECYALSQRIMSRAWSLSVGPIPFCGSPKVSLVLLHEVLSSVITGLTFVDRKA